VTSIVGWSMSARMVTKFRRIVKSRRGFIHELLTSASAVMVESMNAGR